MMKIILFLSLLLTLPRIEAAACFPESPLRFKAGAKNVSGLNEFEAKQLVARFERALAPLVKKEKGKKLFVHLEWENERVNAHCTLDDYDNPAIHILGGMARHPQMSRDGFLLILCHELGHYMGGAPFKFRGNSQLLSWASVEGQADYFATSQCLPLVFNDQLETKAHFEEAQDKVASAQRRCGADACVRSSLAGLAVANVFASMKLGSEVPGLDREDSTQVSITLQGHPNPQCRLDTFVAGANIDQRPQCWFSPSDEVY